MSGGHRPAEQVSDAARQLFEAAVDAYESGKRDAAATLASQVLAIHKQHAGALYMLGTLKFDTGEPAMALPYLENAAFQIPHNVKIWQYLGMAYYSLKQWPKAVESFQNAVKIGPPDASILNHLGLALREMGDTNSAVASYRHALELQPDDPDIYNNLGIALNFQHDFLGAMDAYRQSLELNPDNAYVWTNLAMLYEQANKLEEAHIAVTRGLALSPKQEHLHLVAAKCERRLGKYRAAISILKSALDAKNIDGTVGRAMEFELGRNYDALGDIDDAYAHFLRGNRLTGQIWPDLVEQAQSQVPRLESILNAVKGDKEPAPMQETDNTLNEGNNLVFLVGFPRSGTTLMDTILDAHPSISVLEEEPIVDQIITSLRELPGGYPRAALRLSIQERTKIRAQYWQTVETLLGDKAHSTIIIDKNPFYSTHAGFIYHLFPAARFILALRHPCDVVLSCFMQPFGRNPVLAALGDLQTAAQMYSLVMEIWREYRAQLPLKVHEIRYEALVMDKDREILALLDFLDLDWVEALSDHTAHARARGRIYTPSYHQVIRPVYRDALGRWKRYATYLAPIVERLRPLAENFGYDLQV